MYIIIHQTTNIKNQKINFSFVSAHFASFMYIWTIFEILKKILSMNLSIWLKKYKKNWWGRMPRPKYFLNNFFLVGKLINHNSKNKNCKNRKSDFSFNSALCTSCVKMGAKLRRGRGLHILTWDKADIIIYFSRLAIRGAKRLAKYFVKQNISEANYIWGGFIS